MSRKGIAYAVGAYVFWGLFPLYWKQLESVPPLQLVGHRVIWSFVLLVVIILATSRMGILWKALSRRTLQIYGLAAILISTNWFVYIWAVEHDHVVDASLGYYINPLFSVVLGLVVFHERLRGWQWLPVGLAAAGVAYLTISFGSLPWIALVLALSFGLYGMIKKIAPLASDMGLAMETGFLLVPALAYLVSAEIGGTGAFLHVRPALTWLMAGGGVVTAVPLLLFAAAAPRVPLSTIGMLQYINPTLQLVLGVVVYHEAFTHARWIGFALVWLGLIVFWVEGLFARRSGAGQPLPELGEG